MMKGLGEADKAIQLVGQGGFGKVFRFVEHEREFAIKEIILQKKKKNSVRNDDKWREIEAEVNLVKGLGRHRNLISYYRCWQQKKTAFILMELFKGRNMEETPMERDLYEIWNFIMQLCLILSKLKQRRVVHKDVKPDNIIVDSFKYAENEKPLNCYKLIDFGLAKQCSKVTNKCKPNQTAPFEYVAPQIVARKTYAMEADMYSLGLMLFELTNDTKYHPKLKFTDPDFSNMLDVSYWQTGFNPTFEKMTKFKKQNDRLMSKYRSKILSFRRKVTSKNRYDCKELDILINRMLSHCPEQRPTPEQILRMEPVFESLQIYKDAMIKQRIYTEAKKPRPSRPITFYDIWN